MNISEMHRAFKLELDKTTALELPAFEPEEIDYWLNVGIRRFVKTRYTGSETKISFEQTVKRSADLATLLFHEDLTPSSDSYRPDPPTYIVTLLDLTHNVWFTVGEEVTIQYHDIRDSQNTTRTKRQGITQCTLDTYRSHIDDPYSEHRLHYEEAKPLRLFFENYVELVTDGNYEVTAYHVRYLKKPERVNIISVTYANGDHIEAGLKYLVSVDTVLYNGDVYNIGDTITGEEGISLFTGAGSITTLVANCDLPEHTHDEIVKVSVAMALENIEQPRYQTYLNELKNVE